MFCCDNYLRALVQDKDKALYSLQQPFGEASNSLKTKKKLVDEQTSGWLALE